MVVRAIRDADEPEAVASSLVSGLEVINPVTE